MAVSKQQERGDEEKRAFHKRVYLMRCCALAFFFFSFHIYIYMLLADGRHKHKTASTAIAYCQASEPEHDQLMTLIKENLFLVFFLPYVCVFIRLSSLVLLLARWFLSCFSVFSIEKIDKQDRIEDLVIAVSLRIFWLELISHLLVFCR